MEPAPVMLSSAETFQKNGPSGRAIEGAPRRTREDTPWWKRLLRLHLADSLDEDCDSIAKTSPNDVHEIARLMQKMIISYYRDVQRQASLSFVAALILEVLAVYFFMSAAKEGMALEKVNVLAGVTVQVMTGVVFYFYSQSARQFAAFHICLERTNRFLLANGLVEHLPEAERSAKRAEVITTILNAPMLTLELFLTGRSSSTSKRRSRS